MDPYEDDEESTLESLVQDVQTAMLTTVRPDGSLHSRPMSVHTDPPAKVLRLLAPAATPKVNEAQHDEHVNLTFSDPGHHRYASVSGTARTEQNPQLAERIWRAGDEHWAPRGPNDPELAVLTIEVNEAEIWDPVHERMVPLRWEAELSPTDPQIIRPIDESTD